MQVFKTFFKLIYSYKKTILIYFLVFLAMIVMLTKLQYSQNESGFQQQRLNIGVIDNDQSEYTKGMMEYFSVNHDMKLIEDDREAIVDELYWRTLDYILVIPKGFTDSLENGSLEAVELSSMKVPGYFEAEFFESDLKMYHSKLVSLLEVGMSVEEANKQLMKLQESSVNVKLASFVNDNQNDVVSGIYGNMPYFFIAVGVSSIALVLIAFNRQEIKDRTECSPTTLKNRSAGIICGMIGFGMILLIVSFLIVLILSGGKALTDVRIPYFMINAMSIMIFSVSLGYLAGNVSNSTEVTNGIVNVVSLLLCFLGGVFVPQEFFGEGIERVAKILPTYWYVHNNSMISKVAEVNGDFIKEILLNCSISALYAVAVFAISLVIINAKRKRA